MKPSDESRPGPVDTMPQVDRPKFRAEHFLVVLGILVVLLIAGVMGAKPAYRLFKSWRANGLASEVMTLLDGGDEDQREAARRIRAAVKLAPHDPDVLRTTARYCKRVAIPDGMMYWRLLIETGHATDEDRMDAAQMAIELGQIGFAADQVERALKADTNNLRGLTLRTQLLTRQGRIPGAIASARRALAVSPEDADSKLALGSLQLRSAKRAQQIEGTRLLLNLATNAGPRQDAALAQIAASGWLTKPEAETVLRVLDGQSNRPVQSQLQAASIRLALEPEARPSIFRGVFDAHLSSTNESVRADVADWAFQEGGASNLLAALPKQLAELDALGLRTRLEAAAMMGQWEEFDHLAATGSAITSPIQLNALNALRLSRNQQRAEASDSLMAALKACGKNARALTLVALTAERSGLTNEAIAAWQRQLTHPSRGLNAARQVIRLSSVIDDLGPTREALECIYHLNPGNTTVARRLAYLNLLLDVHVPEAEAIFRELQEQSGDTTIARLGLAYAQWRSGDALGALAAAERESVDMEKLPQNWRAVYVALLGAADRRAAARELAGKVDLAMLRPVERALVEPWR